MGCRQFAENIIAAIQRVHLQLRSCDESWARKFGRLLHHFLPTGSQQRARLG
ncbi:CD36 family protein [Anopheles sinensis]|uniref:CD36 family protein n=1 Tax=Anopheles sinensis TaxID=74873 RepID=A0A084W0P0_ANOSI|nr:CD36 family protein [Anopheles sinensis]